MSTEPVIVLKDLTEAQTSLLIETSRAASAASIAGSCIVLFTFLTWRAFRNTTTRLLFFMSVGDLISATAKIFGVNGYTFAGSASVWCKLQACAEQIGDVSSILWTTCMSWNLVLALFYNYDQSQLRGVEKWYHLYVWGFTAFCAFYPFIADAIAPPGTTPIYSDASLWCWINKNRVDLQLGLLFIPLWIAFTFNLTIYSIIGYRFWWRKLSVENQSGGFYRGGPEILTAAQKHRLSAGNFTKSTIVYLFAFLISWTPSTVNRVYNAIDRNQMQLFVLVFMQGLFSPLRGFTNFAAYFIGSFTRIMQLKREAKLLQPELLRPMQYPPRGVGNIDSIRGAGPGAARSEISISRAASPSNPPLRAVFSPLPKSSSMSNLSTPLAPFSRTESPLRIETGLERTATPPPSFTANETSLVMRQTPPVMPRTIRPVPNGPQFRESTFSGLKIPDAAISLAASNKPGDIQRQEAPVEKPWYREL